LGDALGITTGDLAAPNDELGSALKQGFCCAWLVKETIFDSLRHGTRLMQSKTLRLTVTGAFVLLFTSPMA
jgi:hypothetical protein